MASDHDAGKTPSPLQKRRKLLGSQAVPDILLVEDVPVSKKVVTLSLIKAHYTVDIASSGEEALQKIAKQHNYKLCLMDIGLPGINGVETTRRIRQMERQSGLAPLVIFGLTASVEPEELKTYEAAGMNGCIMKGAVVSNAVEKAIKMHAENPTVFVDLTEHGVHAPTPNVRHSAHARSVSGSGLAGLAGHVAPLSPALSSSDTDEDSVMSADPDQDALMTNRGLLSRSPHAADSVLLAARRRLGLGVSNPQSRLRASLTTGSFDGREPSASISPQQSGLRLLSSRSYCDSPLSAAGSPASPKSPASDSSLGSPAARIPSPLQTGSSLSRSSTSSLSRSSSLTQLSPNKDYDCLLVEDVRVSQRVAHGALTRAGFKVDVAADGETAVAKFASHNYRIILMDIGLPGMSGIEACIKIRALEKENNRPACIIFGLTGNTDESNLHTYAEAGMNGCIPKGGILGESVQEALEQHNQSGGFVDPGTKARRSQPYRRTGPSAAAVAAANKILMSADEVTTGTANGAVKFDEEQYAAPHTRHDGA